MLLLLSSEAFWKQFACVSMSTERRGEGRQWCVQPEPWQMYLLSKCRAHFLHMPWALLLSTYSEVIVKAERFPLGPDNRPSPAMLSATGSREEGGLS